MEKNYQILLGSAKSTESVADSNFINIELEGNNTLIEETEVQTLLDLNDQYVKERDSCTKYRLTITINPMCTNVLCNPTSTIIKRGKVGDKNDKLIANTETGTKMTKYIYKPVSSVNNDAVDYYMGYDIFDNIYFRTKSIRLGKFMDDRVGVMMGTILQKTEKKEEYAYLRDNINGYDQAIRDNLVESNGWIQCINPSRIMLWDEKYENNKKIGYSLKDDSKINFVKGGNCEKTDLFPTREMLLFNTLFKYNASGRLINEENWSYFLSYPYKNDYNHWLVHTSNGENSSHGIPVVYITKIEKNDDNNPFNKPSLIIQTAYPNKFKVSNKIRIYYNKNGKLNDLDFTVQRVIDDTRFYVLLNSLDHPFLDNGTIFIDNVRIKKIVNGVLCDYYVKQFRKIPNWKFENEKITPNNIDKKLETNKQLFNSTKYNLAYGKNIFDDKMVQISFTDSVDINLLEDNLGRPLTKIYLTIYKNNEHEIDWSNYFKQNLIDNNTHVRFEPDEYTGKYKTDFQRYWSKNSVGYELTNLTDSGNDYVMNYPNIYCMHNLKRNIIPYNTDYKSTITETGQFSYPRSPNSIDNYIEDKSKPLYYGDICEFDKSNFVETVLSKCQYRFNTVNRESELFHDKCIVTHGIALFNNDGISTKKLSQKFAEYNPSNGANTFQTSDPMILGNTTLPTECENIDKDGNGRMIYRGVIQAGPRPEGYYHQAHHPITLKWYENELQYKSFMRIYLKTDIDGYMFKPESCMINNKQIEFLPFFTRSKHNLLQNSLLRMIWKYDAIDYEKTFVISVIRKDDRKILIPYDEDLYNYITKKIPSGNNSESEIKEKIDKLEIYVYDYDTPLWARHIGFGRFVWRNIMSADDAVVNSREEFPFTNGNIYVHKQINFYLRRQGIGCPDMIFKRFPADVSVSNKMNMTELYEDINEIC